MGPATRETQNINTGKSEPERGKGSNALMEKVKERKNEAKINEQNGRFGANFPHQDSISFSIHDFFVCAKVCNHFHPPGTVLSTLHFIITTM